MDWKDGIRRWGRGLAALVLLGALWLLAGPKQESAGPAAVAGPGLGAAHGASPPSPAVARRKVRHVVVHVAGAVRHPGVYKVRAPGRLIDAVRRAGGLTSGADLTQVNLAAHLTDGRQIIVPWLAGVGPAAAQVAAPGGGAGSGAGLAPGTKLSVNAATAEQLDSLDGVGPAMAAAIVALRTKLGGFTKLGQLDDVPGVGEKRLASLQQQLEL